MNSIFYKSSFFQRFRAVNYSLFANGYWLLTIGYSLLAIHLTAADNPVLESKVKGWIHSNSAFRFTENRGQMADLQNKPVQDLLFKTNGSGVDMYITTWGMSYVFDRIEKRIIPQLANLAKLPSNKREETGKFFIQYCRADMELLGAEIKKENCVKEFESDDRVDYYQGGICPNGILNVHSYERITIKNIYPGIDWVIYKSGGIKYDFIVHPGADPSVIRIRYKWTDKPALQKDSSLRMNTPKGSIVEGNPFSYTRNKNQRINAAFNVTGNTIGFKLGEYNKQDTLIIDPALIWATYSGGSDWEDVTSISADGSNVWVTGSSAYGSFPTLNPNNGSAYFQGFGPGADGNIVLMKFNSCGKLLWSTFYGGTGTDVGNSISSDGQNIWVTGQTSSSDLPLKVLAGGYNQNTMLNLVDNAFILQFNCTTCSRVWATFYGGSSSADGDIGNSIYSDGTNVWVTGNAGSTDFPVLNPGGQAFFQENQHALFNSGTGGNAFILQFDCGTGKQIWATYYGGENYDQGLAICSDKKNVWLTGSTNSTGFPVKNLVGAYDQSAPGGFQVINAFVVEFSCTDDSRIWASYFGGSVTAGFPTFDQGNSISSDGKSVWVCGTTGSTDFPLQPQTGYYNQSAPAGPNGTAFLLQLGCEKSNLIWSTYYGGSGVQGDQAYSIQSDQKNVWVSGSSTSTDFPIWKPSCGFIQDTLGKDSAREDVFILQFSTSGTRQWSTFYGSDIENDGSYVSSDGINVFVSGDARLGNTYPILNPGGGAYFVDTIGESGSFIDYYENYFMAKFSINCSDSLIVTTQDTSICKGSAVELVSQGGYGSTWSPSSGLSSSSGTSVKAQPTSTTTYTVSAMTNATCAAGIPVGAMVTVKVKECDSMKIFVPNVFSPNGDGTNDQFYFTTTGISTLAYSIYDRWGILLFNGTNISSTWDGRAKSGEQVPDGTYFFTYNAQTMEGKTLKGNGFIQLLRGN